MHGTLHMQDAGMPARPRNFALGGFSICTSLHKRCIFRPAAGRKVGIIVGKTRFFRWGFFLLAMGTAAALFFYNPVKSKTPVPLPEATPGPGPLQGWTVCLDAGHGGYDGGAYGRVSGTPEKELNLDVAQRLQALLQDAGARVIMTRETDTALAEEGPQRKRRDLQYRVDCAREAHLFLSIHMNEYRTAAESGPQVFYKKGAEGSRLLAGVLQQQMNSALSPARPRAAHPGEYYLLEHLDIPAVLVECGFLSNAREEARLLTAEYRQQVAESLYAGLAEYAGLPAQ